MVNRNCTSDAKFDENGEPVLPNEPKVSKMTGKRRKAKPRAIKPSEIDKICGLIRSGNYVKTSVKAVGVNYNTFLTYMKQGKKGIRPYDEYYEKVEMAKAGFETDAVSSISESGANGNVGAYMWMLPRMYPKRWQTTQRIEAEVDNTQKIELVRFSDKTKKSEDD